MAFLVMPLDNPINQEHPAKRYHTHLAVITPDSTIAYIIQQSFGWLFAGNGKMTHSEFSSTCTFHMPLAYVGSIFYGWWKVESRRLFV